MRPVYESSFKCVVLLCLFLVMTACAKSPDRPAGPPNSTAVSQAPQPAPVSSPPESAPARFDLGGPCLLSDRLSPATITGNQKEELRSDSQWEPLIEAAKQDVRGGCSVPYRWQTLFTALVNGHRYADAVKVLDEMKSRGFPLPHSLLSEADAAFRTSDEFTQSAIGIEYRKREDEVQRSIKLAEEQLAAMNPNELPANPYISKGACPFECCTYREWKTKSAVQLRESIGSEKIIAEIPAGTSIRALTGEVHVEPEPYAVLADNGMLKAGDVIFFLDYRGEGYTNYWYQGRLSPDIGADDGLASQTTENCQANAAKDGTDPCWLTRLRPQKKFLNEWWVQLRTKDGKVGWTLNIGQFENMDSCG